MVAIDTMLDALELNRRHVLGAAGTVAAMTVLGTRADPAAAAPSPSLLTDLKAAVDAEGFLTGDAILPRFIGSNFSSAAGVKPVAVLRPKSTAEVVTLVKLCNTAGQSLVPQGGMTGLVSGGKPTPTDIVLSLERMSTIEELDEIDATMTVGAGTVLMVAQQYADARGFLFGVDMGSRGQATIGGMVATNAGGVRVVRYGMMRENVLGVEAVLADGTLVSSMAPMLKNNAGYDVKQLFIGSEGTLGIVTRAVLRLRPRPEATAAALVAIDGFANVPAFLRHMQQSLGGTLSSFEVMWADFDAFVRKYAEHLHQPLPAGHGFYVITEGSVADPAVDGPRFAKIIDEARGKGLIADVVVANSEEERQEFWALREEGAAAFGELGPFFGYDVSMRIADMDGFAKRVHAELATMFPGCTTLIMGHMGDGNLHVIVAPGSRETEVHHRANDVVYGAIRDLKGSVSAEHGIGKDKKDYLTWSRSESEVALMRTLKATLDPKSILNPGKVL